MKKLSSKAFNRLCQNSTVLAADHYGDKVILLTDNTILKLFRLKRIISSALIYSPAKRFKRNAQKLQRLAIPTVSIIEVFKIKSIKRTAVHYQQLSGETIRDYLQKNKGSEYFLKSLGKFIAHLHESGIYFRSAHFGNLIFTPDKQFGLIDISDMKIYSSPLNKNKRLRNLKHIFRLAEDIDLIKNNTFIEQGYLEHCTIKSNDFQKTFLNTCKQLKHE
jgi:tRNA A-37 threonylcarbamoyl transferase component Bud32